MIDSGMLVPEAPRWWRISLGLLVTLLLVWSVYAVLHETAWPALPRLADGSVLEQARLRGKLVVGVREIPRPSLPGTGILREPELADAELAQALGRYLAVPVELLGLAPEQRMAALRERRIDLLIAGAAEPESFPVRAAIPIPVALGHRQARLIGSRHLDLNWPAVLAGRSVCLAEGSPLLPVLRMLGAEPRLQSSALLAATAFMAGECQLLAEEQQTAEWLLQQPNWRFYRALPFSVEQPNAGHIQLVGPDDSSTRWLAVALRDWQRQGGQEQLQERRFSDFGLDLLKLENGLVCH